MGLLLSSLRCFLGLRARPRPLDEGLGTEDERSWVGDDGCPDGVRGLPRPLDERRGPKDERPRVEDDDCPNENIRRSEMEDIFEPPACPGEDLSSVDCPGSFSAEEDTACLEDCPKEVGGVPERPEAALS